MGSVMERDETLITSYAVLTICCRVLSGAIFIPECVAAAQNL